jgi:hypothetical protein
MNSLQFLHATLPLRKHNPSLPNMALVVPIIASSLQIFLICSHTLPLLSRFRSAFLYVALALFMLLRLFLLCRSVIVLPVHNNGRLLHEQVLLHQP